MNTYMAGTENTGNYTVVAEGNKGRIGFRNLGPEGFRVRIEPVTGSSYSTLRFMEEFLTENFDAEWKVPGDDGQFRFSTVVGPDKYILDKAIAVGLRVIEPITEVNPAAPPSMKAAAGVEPKKDTSAEVENLKNALLALLKAL